MEEQSSKPSFSFQDLDNMSFDNQNLEGVSFANATIKNSSFNNANLLGADFSEATIIDTSFRNAKFGHSSDQETEMLFRVFCQIFWTTLAFADGSSSNIDNDYPSESKISELFTCFLIFTCVSVFYVWKILIKEFKISIDVIGVLTISIIISLASLVYAISLLRDEVAKPRLTRFRKTKFTRVEFGLKNPDDINLFELSGVCFTQCDLEEILNDPLK